jgi:hypothetical protein
VESIIQPDPDQVHRCLARILASAGFARAPRMRRLLTYLADHALGAGPRCLSEYAIGVDVFGRDAGSYDTCIDPIVRVQAGRLRGKLQQYFNAEGADEIMQWEIPAGSYALRISSAAAPMPVQLQCISIDPLAAAFSSGVNEELAYFLQSVPCRTGSRARAEGSLRVDAERIRVALRLADSGRVLWTRQLDFAPELTIAAQEHVGRMLGACLQEAMHELVQL